MRIARPIALVLVLVGVVVLATSAMPLARARPTRSLAPTEAHPPLYLLRVGVESADDVRRLTSGGWDVIEARGPDHLLVIGGEAVVTALRAQGFDVAIAQVLQPPRSLAQPLYYGGYRSVAEHYAHLDAVAAAYPELATVVDYGDSWRKVNSQAEGYDLKAICITRLRPGDCALDPDTSKARFLLIAAIHARELTTAEQAWRLIDLLVESYDQDADITALLNDTEVWIVPVTNPDGRAVVEAGADSPYTQRKNVNDSLGRCLEPPTDISQYGIDLNRNASFKWGASGSSPLPCNLTYRGPSPASEPEAAALESLMSALFRDQRGPNDPDPAPVTTTGAMLTLHSYSNLVLLPWGWTECNGRACPPELRAPNDAGLRSFAFRMSAYNGYDTGQSSELLYAASGTTDDWAYGVLGIPGFTFEIGPQTGPCGGFFPDYACQDSLFWPLNRAAFVYAAKAARQPYAETRGPTTVQVREAHTVLSSTTVLTAAIDDGLYGTGVDRPEAQAIAAAEAYVDVPPWSGGVPIGMAAQDGAFDSAREVVTVALGGTLAVGRHLVYVRGRDADGNWGPPTAQWLYVDEPGSVPTATPEPTVTPEPTPVRIVLPLLARP